MEEGERVWACGAGLKQGTESWFVFFSSRRRHTRFDCDWSSDVCSSDLSAEGFALAGDVPLWRGQLTPAEYSAPTPDGRPATRALAGERLARVVCADREMLDDAAIGAIADALCDAQVTRIAEAVTRVCRRHAALALAVGTRLRDFLAPEAGRPRRLDGDAPSATPP